MHGATIKIVDAQQARLYNNYKKTKCKLLRTNAAVWFNKTCKISVSAWVGLNNNYSNMHGAKIKSSVVHLLIYVVECTVTDWPLNTQTSCSKCPPSAWITFLIHVTRKLVTLRSNAVLRKVTSYLVRRVRKCIQADGGHFEQFAWVLNGEFVTVHLTAYLNKCTMLLFLF